MSCVARGTGLVWLLAWVTWCSLLFSNRHPRTPYLGKVSGVGSLHMKKVVHWTWYSVFSVNPIAFRHWVMILFPIILNCSILTLKSIVLWLRSYSCPLKVLLAVKWAGNMNTLVCQNSKWNIMSEKSATFMWQLEEETKWEIGKRRKKQN